MQRLGTAPGQPFELRGTGTLVPGRAELALSPLIALLRSVPFVLYYLKPVAHTLDLIPGKDKKAAKKARNLFVKQVTDAATHK